MFCYSLLSIDTMILLPLTLLLLLLLLLLSITIRQYHSTSFHCWHYSIFSRRSIPFKCLQWQPRRKKQRTIRYSCDSKPKMEIRSKQSKIGVKATILLIPIKQIDSILGVIHFRFSDFFNWSTFNQYSNRQATKLALFCLIAKRIVFKTRNFSMISLLLSIWRLIWFDI